MGRALVNKVEMYTALNFSDDGLFVHFGAVVCKDGYCTRMFREYPLSNDESINKMFEIRESFIKECEEAMDKMDIKAILEGPNAETMLFKEDNEAWYNK